MRRIFFLLIAFIFVAGTSAAPAAQNDDFLIVPGERVGAITGDASEDSLRAIYGGDRVESVLVSKGEGFFCKGSRVLFDNGEFLEVTWLDTEAKASPDFIQVKGKSWQTGDGISLGISLQEIEEINGKPFRLLGFEWDYGGTIISWEGGNLEGQPREMWLALTPDQEAYQQTSGNEAGQVSGDREFSSGHPVMQKLNPRLMFLAVDLDLARRCEEFEE